jgi:hypothetical protein
MKKVLNSSEVVSDPEWAAAAKQRDSAGRPTSLALALDAIAGNGGDCRGDKPRSCLVCRYEAALRDLYAQLKKSEEINKDVLDLVKAARDIVSLPHDLLKSEFFRASALRLLDAAVQLGSVGPEKDDNS